MSYFKKFGVIEYDGIFCKNILSNIFLDKSSVQMLEYNLQDSIDRPDVLAKKYYDSFGYDWLVMLSNSVIDPYYDLGLSESNFQEYIEKKYGSIEYAQQSIAYWRNNWRDDDTVLTVAGYAALPEYRKKYFKEVLNYNSQLVGYERKKEDWIVSTNVLMRLDVTGHELKANDQITQGSATAIVTSISKDFVIVKDVQGTFSNGSLSSHSLSISGSKILHYNIPVEEAIYWDSVSYFEDEYIKNSDKRIIQLADNRQASRIEDEIEEKLK